MKILFLTRFDFTSSKKDGGLLGTYRNYRLLEKIYGKENVAVYIITHQKCDDYDNVKYFYMPNNIISSYMTYMMLEDRISRKVERKIVECINEEKADLIFFDGSTFGQLVKKINHTPHKVVYFHNIERQYTWEQVKYHSPLCIFRYITTVYNEKKMVQMTDNLICVNKRDAELLEKYYKKKSNFIFPATFTDSYIEGSKNEEETNSGLELLFVGSYFKHNYKGLLWFINNVLPEINCKLVIVGKNMEKLNKFLRKETRRKIELKGTVEDLDIYYRKADAVIMPIFMGGGIKVKTAEALMYGKTLFASDEALEGYDVNGIKNIYRCNTKEEFLRNIHNYAVSKMRKKMNIEVRNLFLNNYCTELYENKFKSYLDNI